MYATVDDVKRQLGISPDDTSRDGEIAAALEGVESWVERQLRSSFAGGPPVTVTFHRVRSDGTVQLPEEGTVTAVESTEGTTFQWYEVTPGVIRLTSPNAWIGEWTPERHVRPYYVNNLEVTYTRAGTVPAAVREGVALLAADLVPRLAQIDSTGEYTGPLKSERIGDYQWTALESELVDGVRGHMGNKGLRLLRPWLKGRRVVAI